MLPRIRNIFLNLVGEFFRRRTTDNGQQTTVNGQPTPNRAQSTDAGVSVKISLLNLCRATRKKTRLSLLELPRCEGGKDHEVGLTDNSQQTIDNRQRITIRMGLLTVDY